MRKIMASLDIGANALKLVVAETVGEKLNILGVSTIPNNTIKKGKIISLSPIIPEPIPTQIESIDKAKPRKIDSCASILFEWSIS